MFDRRAFLIVALASNLAACAGGELTGGSNGSAAGVSVGSQEQNTAYGGNLEGIEIRRIGNDQVYNREYQNRAIYNSLAYTEKSGIARERIKSITVDTTGGEQSGGLLLMRTAPRYRVWINIEGCDASVSFYANSTGQVASPSDKSGCLSAQP